MLGLSMITLSIYTVLIVGFFYVQQNSARCWALKGKAAMKRNQGEPFEEYRARRKAERKERDTHLRGTLVVANKGLNRAARRAGVGLNRARRGAE